MIDDWSVYPNFRREEFSCRCGCNSNEMQPEFLGRLQALRLVYKQPMVITSGYRCPKHPREAGKAVPGMHTTGQAADIGVSGAGALTLLRLALEAGFTGIGVHQKGNGRFLHLDTRAQPAIWSY